MATVRRGEKWAENLSKGPFIYTLITQPMLQRRPNRTKLRSMDSYIQILCLFQKCKRIVLVHRHSPELKNPPFYPQKDGFFPHQFFQFINKGRIIFSTG